MFKQLIVAALAALTLTAAQARDIAWIGNRSGGQIVIQTYTCPWAGWSTLRQAYNTTPTGSTQIGCWYLEEASGTVHVTWVTGHRFTYNAGAFSFYPE
jgi:hypothetical protein